ncbi:MULTISPECIES: tape-measure protein [unclassified Streptomyces]|uniref:tape-measure protein n=1 Tax=unclassified Streptomyces TaxID=2593676 RepID=UPI0016561125|nr:tape-measure protein [Streptomyces sp. CB02980]MCB8904035.1 tape-measure protein [Streptomyces sp. CB02980]
MSAVALGGLPNFRAAVPTVNSLARGLGDAGGSLRRLSQDVRQAAGGIGGLATVMGTTGTALRNLGQNASGAATAMGRIRRSTAPTGVRRIGTAAGKARTAAGRIGTGGAAVLGILLPLLPITDVIAGLMGTFGIVMTVASVAMTGVNVAMRANPLGFLVGLIVPVAAYLIELAVNSETGQRLIKQAMQQALKGFQAVWKFLQPIMKLLGEAVGTYFKAYLTLFKTALKIVGAAIGGISKLRSAVSSATNALRGIASRTIGGIKSAVQPVVTWVTDKVPGFFRTAKDAVSKAMRGIGDLVKGGLSAVIGVVKGPINGLIAFANWIIDGLNKLSFEIPLTGKKFGVELDKIPMLADGGIVSPGSADDYRIDSLAQLENRRVPALTETPRPPHRVRDFHEEPGAGPRSTAEDLLFLATAAR